MKGDSPDWLNNGMRHIWLPYAQMKHADPPLPVVATEGTRIHLADGSVLVDGIASWWTACHGYNHPHLRHALMEQAARLPHVMFGGLSHEPAMVLATRLAALLPGDLDRVFFAESGSVAVEVAMKMAMQYWLNRGERGRSKILSFTGGYHGDTFATMAVCDPEEGMHALFTGLLPDHHVRPLPRDGESLAALESFLDGHAHQIAAMLVEPLVQGAGGMLFHGGEVLRTLRALADRYGILLIFDEIFTGFGRTGTMFACQAADVVPDIITLSKALTGGTLPLSATVARAGVFDAFWSDDPMAALMHGPTYMGNALACAVANASLDLFDSHPRMAQVSAINQWLAEGLEPCRGLPGVVDVRTLGAIGVVQMDRIKDLRGLKRLLVAEGAWIRPFRDILYLTPAFTATQEDVMMLTGAITRGSDTGPTMIGPAGFLDMLAAQALDALDMAGRRRTLRAFDRDGIRLRLPDGQVLIDVASNDYLGLAQDPGIIDRAAEYVARFGAGAGASRLVCGTLTAHQEVEEKLAAFLGTEAALLFGTGFQANATLLPALAELLGAEAELLVDRLSHASILNGAFAHGVKARRFRHNDLNHLEDLLKEAAGQRLVVTESVFSMDGDRADLSAIADLADRYGAPVYVDEAHAIGVLGPEGRGLCATMPGRIAVTMGTLGKAFGGFGAYVAGSRLLIDYLANRCAGFLYTTAPPPAVLGALDAALDVIPSLDMERMRLAAMADAVRMAVAGAGYDTGASSTQIIPVIAGPEQAALALQQWLEMAGFLAVAIRPPTVPAGTARLRLSLSSALDDHTAGQLLSVLSSLPPPGMGIPG